MLDRAGQRAEWRAERGVPGKGQRAHRVAVIGAVECNKGLAAGELARRFERAFDRLRAAVGKIGPGKGGRQMLGEPLREPHLRLEHVLAINHHVQMAARLTLDRGEYGRIAVAERRNADPGDEIEMTAPVGGVDPGAIGARHLESDRRVGGLREMAPKKIVELAYWRVPASKSRNAPPPWRHVSGGACIWPGAAT